MKDNEKWSSASLRISSEIITLKEICEILNTNASSSFAKGTRLNAKNPNSLLRPENLWILNSNLNDLLPLEKHIEELINFLEEKSENLKELIGKCGFEMFCGFSSTSGQGGVLLSANLLKRITVFPIDVVLDLYPPEGNIGS